MAEQMTRKDRDQLAQVAKMRSRVAKAQIEQRELSLRSQVEDEMKVMFDTEDEQQAEAMKFAHALARETQERLSAWLDEHEVPERMRPAIGVRPPDRDRHGDSVMSRRAALRQLANARIKALGAQAKVEIDRSCADTVTQLIAGGLDSDTAQTFLNAMPTVDGLMLSPSVADLEAVYDEDREHRRGLGRGFDV